MYVRKRKLVTYNPFLNEYLYTIIYSLTDEQRKTLSKATLRLLSTSTKTKNFVTNSTEEEKKRLLTELGYEWSLIIMPRGVKSVVELKRMMEQVNKGRSALGSEYLVKQKMFITSDKQLMYMLGIAAQTISHDNYFLNLDLLKVGNTLKKWKKRVGEEKQDDSLEAIQDADTLDKVIINAMDLYDCSMGLIGITPNELRVLQYFCTRRHAYIEKDEITQRFKGRITASAITTAVKKLFFGSYIRKGGNNRPPKYTITASGIDVVSKFRNRVLSTY